MTSPIAFEAPDVAPAPISRRTRAVLTLVAVLVILAALAVVELGALGLIAMWSSALAHHGIGS